MEAHTPDDDPQGPDPQSKAPIPRERRLSPEVVEPPSAVGGIMESIRGKLTGSAAFMKVEGEKLHDKNDLPPAVRAAFDKSQEACSRDGYYFTILDARRCPHPGGREGVVRYTIIVDNHYRDNNGAYLRWDYDMEISSGALVTETHRSRNQDAWFYDEDSSNVERSYAEVNPESVQSDVQAAIKAEPRFLNGDDLDTVRIDSLRQVTTTYRGKYAPSPTVHLEGRATVDPPLRAKSKFLGMSKEYVTMQGVVPFTIKDGKVSLTVRESSYEEQVITLMDIHDVKNLAEDQPGSVPIDPDADGLGPPDKPEDKEPDDPADWWKKQ